MKDLDTLRKIFPQFIITVWLLLAVFAVIDKEYDKAMVFAGIVSILGVIIIRTDKEKIK